MPAVEHLRHADVGHSLEDDLLHLDRGDADGQGRAPHHPVLADRLAGDHRGELSHQAGPGIEAALGEDFVEGEVGASELSMPDWI